MFGSCTDGPWRQFQELKRLLQVKVAAREFVSDGLNAGISRNRYFAAAMLSSQHLTPRWLTAPTIYVTLRRGWAGTALTAMTHVEDYFDDLAPSSFPRRSACQRKRLITYRLRVRLSACPRTCASESSTSSI